MPPKLQCIIQQKYQFKAARILIGNLKHYLNNDSRLRHDVWTSICRTRQ